MPGNAPASSLLPRLARAFPAPARLIRSWLAGLRKRSTALVRLLDTRIDRIIALWIGFAALAGIAKVLTAPLRPDSLSAALALWLPYLLVALAPIAGYRIAASAFPRGAVIPQPAFRLARLGRWRRLNRDEARANPLFGPVGFMASLLLGMLLNVPVRTLEYLAAVPAVAPGAPDWAQMLFHAMTLDLVVMNFFYAVCFVMALRSVPLFPRMLLFTWALDIMTQLGIARYLSAAPDLPDQVAAPLRDLLTGNIQKVLISAALWLPYILLSQRVNVTYRWRAASAAVAGA